MTDVLLAGFDSDAVGGVAAALADAGFEATRVGDAVAALEALETASVDCAVAAAGLEPAGPRQFVRELRERGYGLPVVCAVGPDAAGDVPPGAEAVVGADPDEVARRVEAVVASRRLAVEQRRRRRTRGAIESAEDALAAAETREEVESVLCRELAAAPGYRSAWVGRYDADTGTVVPAAASGVELAHLGAVSVDGADAATARAVDGEVAVTVDGSETGIAVPFAASVDRPTGVLYLRTGRAAGVPDAERSALADLGSAAGRAVVDAVEEGLPEAGDPFAVLGDALGHELSNQLEIATMHLGLARDREEAESHFEYVEGALDRMAGLAEDARTLASGDVDTGRRDLAAVADAAWEAVETADATLGVEDGTVDADEDLLVLLLENLFRNAVEHGGEDVTVEVGPLDGEGFYVADEGPGVPEAEREAVFEWGYSGEDGMGVGLGIVALVARRHGWSVDLRESEAGGARFEFA